MRVLRSVAELDAVLAECDRAEAVSDDAMRAVFGTFRMDPPEGLGDDPFRPEYRETQLALYRAVAGRAYETANEVTAFDVETAVRRPFPYYTGSGPTAGEHLMGIGFLLKTMALPPGSRVLEFGPGWGNTTLELARLGHHVTCVDIEARFVELIRRRAAREDLSIEAIHDDFFWAERATERFDAVIFFECFHHCDDHLRLLRALQDRVAPGGRLFFGGEPIVPDFPQPWGLRLDGNSLWAIRKNGWLELGFREDYFQEALTHTGWFGRRIPCHDPTWATVGEARRRADAGFRLTGADPRMQTAMGSRRDGAIVLEGREGTGIYGPYAALPGGNWTARLRFRPGTPVRGRALMDVCAGGGTDRLAEHRVDAEAVSAGQWAVTLPFLANTDLSGVEVRLFCEPGFHATVEGMEIVQTG